MMHRIYNSLGLNHKQCNLRSKETTKKTIKKSTIQNLIQAILLKGLHVQGPQVGHHVLDPRVDPKTTQGPQLKTNIIAEKST